MTRKTIKSGNLKSIAAVATADAIACGALVAHTDITVSSIGSVAALRILTGPIAVVVAMLASSVLPANFRAAIVYWRIRDVLPGYRAFSKYAVSDPRIDVASLRNNIGAFPTTPKEQNSRWYKLLSKVDTAPQIVDAHSRFLLFRDITGLSLLLMVLAPAFMFISGKDTAAVALGIFTGQFVIASLAARFSGQRLVANVLALHSLKKYR